MFFTVLNAEGNVAGEVNLDNVDLIKLIESGTMKPNKVVITWHGKVKEYLISKSAYRDLQAYISKRRAL